MKPERTYSDQIDGQPVLVKRYPAVPTPAGWSARPTGTRTGLTIVPEFKDAQQGHADKWLPAADKAKDAADKNEADYAKIREMKPIDGRKRWS